MKELVKKAFYLGVGAAVVTKDKVEEFVDELIRKGEASQSEKGKLIDEFMEKAKAREKELTEKVKTMVQKNIGELKLPSKKEIEELKKKVDELEKQIDKLTKSRTKSKSK